MFLQGENSRRKLAAKTRRTVIQQRSGKCATPGRRSTVTRKHPRLIQSTGMVSQKYPTCHQAPRPNHMTAQPTPLFSSALIRSPSDRTASSFMRLSSRSVPSSSASLPW